MYTVKLADPINPFLADAKRFVYVIAPPGCRRFSGHGILLAVQN